MIKQPDNMITELREHMRDGDGTVEIMHLFNKGEYDGKARLIAKITLHKGCSIGKHIHNNEEEIFYIIKGNGTFDDNGNILPVKQGDATITRNGQYHSIANTGDEDMEIIAVILN